MLNPLHPGSQIDTERSAPESTRASRIRRLFSADALLDGPGFGWLRFIVDLLMLVLAVAATLIGADAANVEYSDEWPLYVFPLLVCALLYARGMYRTKIRMMILDGIGPVVGAISVGAMLVVAVMVFSDPASQPGPLLARAWLFAVVYVGAGRVLLAISQTRARKRGALAKPALIIGAGSVGTHVARRLEEQKEYGLRPIGFLDPDPLPSVEVVDRRAPVLGSPEDLARVAQETGARHVIIAFLSGPDRHLIPLIRRCDELGLEVSLVPRLFEAINERVALEHLGGMPLLGLRAVDPQGWQFALKHGFDRIVAAFTLVALAPLLIPVALTVKFSSPGPVLFRQRRVGRDGKVFNLLKFRSMRGAPKAASELRLPPGAAPGGVEEAVDRRTSVGRVLRRTSVDELPQLLNVLRGQMSLVGPRPERPEFVELFGTDVDRYGDRHRVKSGITGWAQVNGFRGQTSLADRVEWDNFYIENWSLWLDVKIMLLTVIAVLRASPES